MKTSLLFLLLLVMPTLFAEDYPFDLPADFTAGIDINTSQEEVFNNLLLGTNTHDLAKEHGQEMVHLHDPVTIRFPHGLFSNWYDWNQDKARVYGTDQFTYTKDDGSSRTIEIAYLSSIKTMDASNLYVGIDELNDLDKERRETRGEGYDMMWTFNMSEDGTDYNNGCPSTVARYNDLVERGFQVKAIEMGNENFYASQRSSIIPNPSDYIARAKNMYSTLKALDPDLKLSVNLERKSVPANTGWNTELTNAGTDYFDAVSVHTYVGYDPDDNSNSNEAYGVALTAREVLRKTIDDYSRVVAPDKPIWLTEWGVRSGGPNGVSALGMADCYMFMSENQDVYERANWFSVNGKLNSHLVWHEVNGKQTIKEPLEKTSYGSTYEIVRSVYENSIMLGSDLTTPTLDGVVNAVNARAVKKDGKTLIFVVNLSGQEVPFTISMDGQAYYGEFEHKAMAFSGMDAEITLPYEADPLTLIKAGRGGIYLPKLSMNIIEIKEKEAVSLDFINLENGSTIDKGSDQTISAAVADDIIEVSLYVNDTLLSTKTQAPYTWSGFSHLTNMMGATYDLKLVGKTMDDEALEKSITITTPKQWAYTDGFKPHAIPGKVEIEDYDHGGENVAFYDRTGLNASYGYRGDDNFDFNSDLTKTKDLKAREWLEYTIDVAYSGYYDLLVNHQTRRTPDFASMTFSLAGATENLFTDLVCTNTGSSAFAVDTFRNAYLEKGRHILRLDILSYGFDLDYFEWVMTSKAINYHNVGTLNHALNPDSYDTGATVQSLRAPQDSLGYEFAGWYTDEAYTNAVAEPAIAPADNDTKDFYAKWAVKPLAGSASVHGNITVGSTLYVNTAQIEDNSGTLLYQWQRATGEGFSDIAGATSSTYVLTNDDLGATLQVVLSSSVQTGTVITNTTNTVLDAMAKIYTVTYDSNGGVAGDITTEVVGDGGYPTFVGNPSHEGYSVSVWTNANGDTLDAQSVITSDTTLYAQWVVGQRFKVRFFADGAFTEVMTDSYPAFVPVLPSEPLQADSLFDKWYTADGERFDEYFLVFEDVDVYPTWNVKTFPISVASGNGRISYDPYMPLYDIHSTVKLTARPNDGYEFTGWSGDVVSTDTVLTVNVDSVITLNANYQRLPSYKVEVFSSNGIVTQVPYSSRYVKGSVVEFTATPKTGYEFKEWSGDYTGNENPLSLTITEELTLVAVYVPKISSLESNEALPVVVSPNPNNGVFTIDLGQDAEASYTLYTMSGSEIISGQFQSTTEISVDDYSAGVYLLEVTSGQSRSIQRVIFQ